MKKINKAKKVLEEKILDIRLELGACPLQEVKQNEAGNYYSICQTPDLIDCDYKGETIKNNGDSFKVCNYIIEDGYLMEVEE